MESAATGDRLLGWLTLLLLGPLALAAQPQEERPTAPPPDDRPLIYSVDRTPENPFDTARAVQVITADEIWKRNARSLPELLMEESAIFVQQTNYGGGSPIIRGLMGKQILILVDGVQLNNATYRFGPIQYLSTIDLRAVERIEIVRGSDAVLSGNGLGGIINIITKRGPTAAEPVGGSAFARYSSADDAIVGRAEVSGRTEKIRYLVGATYADYGDLEAGGDVGEQAATGYREGAYNFNLDFMIGEDKTLSLRHLGLEQKDVPRTDRVASGQNLVYDFDPQRLGLTSLVYNDLTSRGWSDSLRVTLSYNQQIEDVQEIRTSAPTVERRLEDQQDAFGLQLELSTFLGSSHRLLYGVDYLSEEIDSTRNDVDLVSGSSRSRRGRYTDGAGYDSLGLYLQDRIEAGERVILTVGGRYSRYDLSGSEDTSLGTLNLEGSQDELTGSLGLVVKATQATRFVGTISRAFRNPNIDDVSVFDQRPEGTEVPNPGLEAETMVTYEVGIKHDGQRLSGQLFYYSSNLDNLIERSSGTFQGLPFFDLDGDGVRDPGEPGVLQKQNIGQAAIDGLELDFQVRLTPDWRLIGYYTDTSGDDEVNHEPLSRIPPAFGKLAVRWSPSARRLRPWAELVYLFADDQRRIGSRDAADDRIGPGGTAGFDVFTLRGGLSLDRFRFTAAAENLTDEGYKYHSSGIYRPGRQLVLGAELSF